MAGTNTVRREAIERDIRHRKVVSFDDALKHVDCSSITLRRDLKALNAITSYTDSGRYVTLPEIPCFNEQGIWKYRRIGFSKFGSSLNTIVGLIEQGSEGFSQSELETLLGIKISQQIQVLLQRGKVHRVKLGNRYLYIPEAAQKNQKKRIKLVGDRQTEEYFEKDVQKSDLIALLKAVLVEKKIDVDINSLKHLAKKYSLRLPLQKIHRLLVLNQAQI